MAVSELPFELAEVKLAAPMARPGTVAKAGVIARLCAGRSRLVSVVAPAGYGKTTLLARWAETDPRPFAWVSLDGRDDDVVVLLRYLAGAIHRVESVAPEVFQALTGPGGSTWSKRVPRFGSALGAVGRPFVLVLDDLHTIANPLCLDVLAELLQYVPPGSRIAVSSRAQPALPLGRWRAQGWVDEIRVADLQLDDDEAARLLQVAGVELNEADVSELTDRTEGWPAGLYLAALSLQAGASISAGATSFSGNDRFVSEYFEAELVSRLPAAESHFLKYTSVLDRLCGDLCDSVLHTSRSADTLETLERANCFVVALDRQGEWYRYHHLFGELLRGELERSEPDVAPALNRRAMTWCLANGLPEAAVAYGRAAGEMDTVAGLVDSLALHLYWDGRLETLERWLGWFSESELERYPALAVYGGWVYALTGRPAEAERWLGIAEATTSAVALSDGSATIEPWTATLRACMMANGVDQALADADRALELFPPDSAWRAPALLTRGVAFALVGATDRAIDDFSACIETGLVVGAVDDAYVAEAQLALLAAGQGAWREASERANAAQALVDDAGLGDYASSAIAHVATARVALHEARKEDAVAALARAHRLRPMLDHGLPWLSIQVGLELTRVHLALADPAAARTVLTETEEILERRPQMGLLNADARELRDHVSASSAPSAAWAMSLTGAELRLLPYLATHLTFPEIASRLYISHNTAKTEAVSIYRKFGISSRSQAIARAIEVGLLDNSIYPARVDLTLPG